MTAAERLAEARAILGAGIYDPMRAVWDDKASEADRQLLLRLAGVSNSFEALRYSGRGWAGLAPEMRSRIKSGLSRFRRWAALLEDGGVLP